jgi:hypothetical protein
MNSIIPCLFFLIFINLAFASSVTNNPPYSQKYPYNVLTPSHGILSEKDLEYDLESRNLRPYNAKELQPGSLFWQCFEVKNVKHKYHSWRDTTDGGLVDNFCSLETWAQRNGETHVYVNRRAFPLVRCREYVKVWKKLTKSEKYACFDGGNLGESETNIQGVLRKTQDWVWERFKTQKGCYAYFPGDCAVVDSQETWKKE